MAYRAIPPTEIECPRCKKKLPPQEVASDKCGTWVSAFAASEVLTEAERRHDGVTRWWRVRAPCPICGEQMLLRGVEPGLFQGCDGHGYWLDADAVEHTKKLRFGVDHDALSRKHADEARVEAEQQARASAERARAEARRQRQQAEANLDGVSSKLGWNDEQSRDVSDEQLMMENRFGVSNDDSVTMGDFRALLERVERLEHLNAELERRIAALEAARA